MHRCIAAVVMHRCIAAVVMHRCIAAVVMRDQVTFRETFGFQLQTGRLIGRLLNFKIFDDINLLLYIKWTQLMSDTVPVALGRK